MDFTIIVSVSTSLINSPEKLKHIDSSGRCIYRFNGSHFDIINLPVAISDLRKTLKNPRIMLDLPGSKIRIKDLSEPVYLNKGDTFELHDYMVNYTGFCDHVKPGNMILTNDATFALEIKEVKGGIVKVVTHTEGLLQNNRGLHINGVYKNLPFIFGKDMDLIRLACRYSVDYLSLSYVRTAKNIQEVKRILLANNNKHTQIFAKIETALALKNLKCILQEVENINIDRGDLSSEIGILKLPPAQQQIIKSAKLSRKNIFLATQFLKNMERYPVPLIAEVIDLYNTIKMGITGIQLSEETAIGKYPVECVKIIFDIYKNFHKHRKAKK